MPWEKISLKKLANQLGLDHDEVIEKHKLISKIKKVRSDLGWNQTELAERVGVSQSRIARIEGGVGTKNMSFDLLFRILAALGYKCTVSMKKVSEERSKAA